MNCSLIRLIQRAFIFKMMILYRIISIGSVQLGTFSQQNKSYPELIFFFGACSVCVHMSLHIKTHSLLISSWELIEYGNGLNTRMTKATAYLPLYRCEVFLYNLLTVIALLLLFILIAPICECINLWASKVVKRIKIYNMMKMNAHILLILFLTQQRVVMGIRKIN